MVILRTCTLLGSSSQTEVMALSRTLYLHSVDISTEYLWVAIINRLCLMADFSFADFCYM